MAIYSNNVSIANDGELIGGGVEWQSVKTASFTAVAGEGYFVNTTSAAITVTLPASPSAGDTVVLKDYARTWATNNVTLASTLLDGATNTFPFSTNGQTVTLVYMDGTKGWSLINDDTTSTLVPANFISATGGTITTSGDFKIHTFTGDGCFVVSTIGNSPVNPLGGPSVVDYLVVAGGGGAGAGDRNGSGGAGGYRESHSTPVSGSYTASPLATPTGLTISATTYPITVGGGGAGAVYACGGVNGSQGSNSNFSTITSAGGGYGGGIPSPNGAVSGAGGSGGGGGLFGLTNGTSSPNAAGNTPPVSPPQGNQGGYADYNSNAGAGGGGGAGAAGDNAIGSVPGRGGAGGAGVTSSITGSPVTRAGGGGGSGDNGPKPGGAGGGGNSGSPLQPGNPGTANTGGGGGGPGLSSSCNGKFGGTGGKGIVVIRYKFQ